MNILIISTNRSVAPVPVIPIGACMIAEAAERAGHTARVLDLLFFQDPADAVASELKKAQYDLIGLSVRNIDNNDMLEPEFYISDLPPLIRAIRRYSDAPVILGGAAVALMPEEILRETGITSAVISDGEVTFPRLLERMAGQNPYTELPGMAVLEEGTCRVNPPVSRFPDACSSPDYNRWLNMAAYSSHLATAPLQTKLGCQFQCVYCTYRRIEGESCRPFDPESVASAAASLVSSGLRDIEFVDSVFNVPYEHALCVCKALTRVPSHARFQSMDLNPVHFDDELLTAMERAGFVGMGMTVESASDQVLRGLRKGFTARDVQRTAEIVKRHRLPCIWIFMFGGPGETRETVKETLRFAEEHIGPQDVAVFNIGIRIYPGTELESIARNQGVLTIPPDEMLAPVFYVSPEVDAAFMRQEVNESMNRHMNFMSVDSFKFPYLPLIHRLAHRLGFKTPIWRYTRHIRTGLRLMGMDA